MSGLAKTYDELVALRDMIVRQSRTVNPNELPLHTHFFVLALSVSDGVVVRYCGVLADVLQNAGHTTYHVRKDGEIGLTVMTAAQAGFFDPATSMVVVVLGTDDIQLGF